MQSDRGENDTQKVSVHTRPDESAAHSGGTHRSHYRQCSSFHQVHSVVCQEWLGRNSCLIPAESEQKAGTTIASELG